MRAGPVMFEFPPQYRRTDAASKLTAAANPLAGRLAREVEVFCAHADLSVYRCDADAALRASLEARRRGAEQ